MALKPVVGSIQPIDSILRERRSKTIQLTRSFPVAFTRFTQVGIVKMFRSGCAPSPRDPVAMTSRRSLLTLPPFMPLQGHTASAALLVGFE